MAPRAKKTERDNPRKKVVTIYALDSKYRRVPYPAIAAEDSQNATYVTGQQYDPDRPGLWLSVKEMTGEVPLTPEKVEAFPFVIHPFHRVNILHGGRFDITLKEDGSPMYPKDVATLNFCKLQDCIALSKSEYKKGKHYFYIDDREKEAEVNVTNYDTEFEAMKLIYENTAFNRMREFSLLLQYYIKGFSFDLEGWTPTMLKENLVKAAKENPKEVIKCGSKTAENDLFVLLLAYHKIIEQKTDGYYNGKDYLGSTPTEVYSFIRRKENEAFASRCYTSLEKIKSEE